MQQTRQRLGRTKWPNMRDWCASYSQVEKLNDNSIFMLINDINYPNISIPSKYSQIPRGILLHFFFLFERP